MARGDRSGSGRDYWKRAGAIAIVILHTNDLHGKLTARGAERIAALRESADFYFDCGDAVKAGNIAIPRRPDPVWELLRIAGCTAGVPGNREFHVFEQGFRAKLAGCAHPMLAANLAWSDDGRSGSILSTPVAKRLHLTEAIEACVEYVSPLPHFLILNSVGVFGLMAQMVTERMAARRVSAFVNTPFVPAARNCIEALREKCAVVICLSHLGLARDMEVATNVGGIDLILGAHSHEELDPPIRVGDTWICQAGAFGRFVGRYVWEDGLKEAALLPLE